MTSEVYCTIHVIQAHSLYTATATFTIHWPRADVEIFIAHGDDPIFAVSNARAMAEERYGPIDNVIIRPITTRITR